jgi:hypothetical protein
MEFAVMLRVAGRRFWPIGGQVARVNQSPANGGFKRHFEKSPDAPAAAAIEPLHLFRGLLK